MISMNSADGVRFFRFLGERRWLLGRGDRRIEQRWGVRLG